MSRKRTREIPKRWNVPRGRPSIWSRLVVPAVLLLIGINVAYFAGNAALDLWQVLGPARPCTGTITGHDDILRTGENADEYFGLTLTTSPSVTFTETASANLVGWTSWSSSSGFSHGHSASWSASAATSYGTVNSTSTADLQIALTVCAYGSCPLYPPDAAD